MTIEDLAVFSFLALVSQSGREELVIASFLWSNLESLPSFPHKDGSETVKLYTDYYGRTDYSQKWLKAAFSNERTESYLSNGKADFTQLDLEGRSAAVRHGIRAITIWGYVVGLVEKTAEDCDSDDPEDNADEQKMWDRAVALYVGSTAR